MQYYETAGFNIKEILDSRRENSDHLQILSSFGCDIEDNESAISEIKFTKAGFKLKN